MPLDTQHLQRSRHGVWYFRSVIPACVRDRHSDLPRELKRSTRTADIRHARVLARRLHRAFALQYALDLGMNAPWPDLTGIRKFELEIDPATLRAVRINAQPHEMDAAMAAVERVQAINFSQAGMLDYTNRRTAEIISEAARTAPAVPTGTVPDSSLAASSSEAPTISEAFRDWSELQRRTGVWTKETVEFTHKPTNRIFRELVGEPMPLPLNDAGDAVTIDLELAQLTPERMARFIREFWDYPERQGQRHTGQTAREVMTMGGTPQEPANAYKRLRLISQFIKHCIQKSWVDPRVLRELEIVLSKDSARARSKLRAAALADEEYDSDGYLSFTDDELSSLFGEAFHARPQRLPQRAAATYWLPLIGLFTAMRVAEMSALEVSDFSVFDGVHCVRVKEHQALSPEVEGSRLKTVASRRTLPLHPKLIDLGLLDYVEQRRAAGLKHLWDGLSWEAKSGYGRYPSSDFRKLAKEVGVYVERRKVLHSLRSTLSQALESAGMATEHIDRLLGHEVKSTRAINYSRRKDGTAVPIALKHRQLSSVKFPINVKPWREVSHPSLSRVKGARLDA